MKEAITSFRFNPHSCQESCLPATPDHCWWTQLLIMIHFPPTAQTFCCPNHSFIPTFDTLLFVCSETQRGKGSGWLWWVRNPHFYRNTGTTTKKYLVEGLWDSSRVISMAFPSSDFLSVKETVRKSFFWKLLQHTDVTGIYGQNKILLLHPEIFLKLHPRKFLLPMDSPFFTGWRYKTHNTPQYLEIWSVLLENLLHIPAGTSRSMRGWD